MSPISNRNGFTLLETLTAVAILGIVMTAAFATFTFQQNSYMTQNRVAEMQQNLRIASDILVRDIRMAGYGVYGGIGIPASAVGAAGTAVTVRGFYPADGGSAAPDGVYILYTYDMDNTVAAYQSTLTTGGVVANGPVTVNVTPGTGTRFTTGSLIVLNNGVTSDMYRVTAQDSNSVTFGTDPYNSSTVHAASNSYLSGSKLSFARFVRYFIDNVTVPGRPMLMMQRLPDTASAAQPVSDDIEELQLAYGLAASTDNSYVSSWADSPSDAQLQLIRQMRLSLVGRTRFPDKGLQGSRPNFENRSDTAPVDGYRRRTLGSLDIDVRNLQWN